MQRTVTLIWCTKTAHHNYPFPRRVDVHTAHTNITVHSATHLASCKSSNPYYTPPDEALARSTRIPK